MKILGIEVESEPFTDRELDVAIESADVIVKLDVIDLKRITDTCKLLNSEGYKISYIHRYPFENITTIGIKMWS